MAGTKVAVTESVRAAIAFARSNVRTVAPALGVLALLEFFTAAQTSRLGLLAAQVLVQLAVLVPMGALYRLAFAGEHPDQGEYRPGPGGFQWKRSETNLLGALLLVILLGVLAFLFWLLLVFILAAAITFARHGPAVTAGQLSPDLQAAVLWMSVAFLVVIGAVYLHICLFQAATVAEGGVQVLSTWKLTRGSVWPIFLSLMAILAPFFALAALAALTPPVLRVAAVVMLALLDAFVRIPLMIGLFAHLYKRLRSGATLAAPAAGAPAAPTGPWG